MKKYLLLFFVLFLMYSCTDEGGCTCTYESQGWNGGQIVNQNSSINYPCNMKPPCE